MSDQSTPSQVVYKSLDFLGFPDYRVGCDGSVWSNRKSSHNPGGGWRRLKPVPVGNKKFQYLQVSLAGKFQRKVHRLILLAFAGPCPAGQEARHANGIRTDNRSSNLTWSTHRDNLSDRVAHGTSNRGERHGHSKLSEAGVREIRHLASLGYAQVVIAKRFHITSRTVSKIVARQRWAHIA